MSGPIRLSHPRASALRGRRINGVVAVLALCVVLGGLSPSSVQAQKSIDFFTTGSVRSTLVFTNQIVPDVYAFFATVGELIRVETSNNSFDTTLRVIGPDASISLFDDDSGTGSASRLVFTAADTGAYLVVVSSFSGNPGGGDYTLNFARGAAAQSLSVSSASSVVGGEPTQGESMSPGENPPEAKPGR